MVITCQNLLIATDFSELSDVALLYGRQLARLFGSRLHAIHVVSDLIDADVVPPADLPDLGVARETREADARVRLRALVTEQPEQDLAPAIVVRTAVSAAAEILTYIRDHAIDLAVVGSHGRGGLAHILLGSVAETIVRSAPCPVLTVRRPERDFVRPDALEKAVERR